MQREFTTVHKKVVRLWSKFQKRGAKNDRERVLLLQCQGTWDIVDSIRILAIKKRGVAAFILCRSLFEHAAVADVLARSTDPQLLSDYIDSGKLILYEVGKAMSAPPDWLAAQEKEYTVIKARMRGKNWYGSAKIEDLVNKSLHGRVLKPDESGLYKTFYKEASSMAHGDSYIYLSRTPKQGWQLTFDPSDRAKWGIRGLALAYLIFSCLLCAAQDTLGVDLNDDFAALIPDLEALLSST